MTSHTTLRKKFIEEMTPIVGDRINDLLDRRGIADCGKSMRGGCDEVVMPAIADWWLDKLSSSATKIREEERARLREDIESMFSEPWVYVQFPAHTRGYVAYDKGGVAFAGQSINIEQWLKDQLLPSEGDTNPTHHE